MKIEPGKVEISVNDKPIICTTNALLNYEPSGCQGPATSSIGQKSWTFTVQGIDYEAEERYRNQALRVSAWRAYRNLPRKKKKLIRRLAMREGGVNLILTRSDK